MSTGVGSNTAVGGDTDVGGNTDVGGDIIYVENIGKQLIASVTLTVGNIGDHGYQSITQKPCKYCGELIITEDIADGYPTIIHEPVCFKCLFSNITAPNNISTEPSQTRLRTETVDTSDEVD